MQLHGSGWHSAACSHANSVPYLPAASVEHTLMERSEQLHLGTAHADAHADCEEKSPARDSAQLQLERSHAYLGLQLLSPWHAACVLNVPPAPCVHVEVALSVQLHGSG